MSRSKVKRMRCSPAEAKDMEAKAKKAGLSWSDLTRSLHGLPITEGKAGVAPGGAPEVSDAQVTIDEEAKKAPITKVEIEEEAKRIYNSEGVPMKVARQRAKKRLEGKE